MVLLMRLHFILEGGQRHVLHHAWRDQLDEAARHALGAHYHLALVAAQAGDDQTRAFLYRHGAIFLAATDAGGLARGVVAALAMRVSTMPGSAVVTLGQKQAQTWSATVSMNWGCRYRANTASSTARTALQMAMRCQSLSGMVVYPVSGGACRAVTLDGGFAHGQVDEGGKNAEGNREMPDHIVVAVDVVQIAAQPHAQEAADLVAEEHKAA